MMRFAVYLGYIAGCLTVASFVPQVIRAWRTKQTGALSVGTFVLIITAGVAWVTYGVLRRDTPVIVTNVGMIALNCAILTAKLRFG
jgi:MtN3 and saliva related transmembrane protein